MLGFSFFINKLITAHFKKIRKKSNFVKYFYYLCSVKVTFDKTYLKDLYEKGKTEDKKHRFQPDIVKRYQQRIKTLTDAPRIETLYQIKALNYEVLSGEKEGISSIRVNDKYRIEFTVENVFENQIVTICNILELSNHYK